jgi:hypothetical protein
MYRATRNVGKFTFKPNYSYGGLKFYIFRDQKHKKEIIMFFCHDIFLCSIFITAEFLASVMLLLQVVKIKYL